MSSCPEAVIKFRKLYPELNKRMAVLALLDNKDDGILEDEEVNDTLERWVEAVEENNNKETYDKIDEELLMIKRGIKGKKIIKNLEEKKPPGWKKGLLWDYLNCIETGKTMSANKSGGRRRRRSTKKKRKKRRKRNLKKRTKRRRRSKRRRRH